MRHILLIAVCLSALLFPAVGASASRAGGSGPLGIVPSRSTGLSPAGAHAYPTNSDNLTYGGGPTMNKAINYVIFWAPSDYLFPSNYQSVVQGYFSNVATASGNGETANVYSPGRQYFDSVDGNVKFDFSVGGVALDTRAFPTSGCREPSEVSGTTVCLNDTQLQAEVQRFATAQGWPHGPNIEFFLYTAPDVGSCTDSTSSVCAYSDYCGYHWYFGSASNPYIYANMPWPLQSDTSHTCDPGERPNGSAGGADAVISVTSHESNESITDPEGTSWTNDTGEEDGDLCAWYFPDSANLGGSADSNTLYNQVINGGHYFIQGEWSNYNAGAGDYSGCVWSYSESTPANSTAPTITGTTSVGSTLTGHAGSWSLSPSNYLYVWLRCDGGGNNCSTISSTFVSSASTTYNPVSADVGHTIELQVEGSNDAGAGSPSTSSATAVIDSGAPVYSSGVSVSGTATVGQVLTGSAGTWSHSPTKYTYVWQRCDSGGNNCTTITTVSKTTATSPTYTLLSGDDKHTVRLSVTAINAIGNSTPQVSAATGVVNGEPVYSSGVSITGTATVGQTLTAHGGAWSPTATKYAYAWERCDASGNNCTTFKTVSASSSTSTAYKLVATDDRHTLRVIVTAQNTAGTSNPQTSSQTGVVNGEPVNTAAPGITGTVAIGQKLTASAGSWLPAASKYIYVWQRCDASGNNCTTISTSTSTSSATSTYTLAVADAGHTIRVSVTASNTAGSSNAAQSAATSTVPSPPV